MITIVALHWYPYCIPLRNGFTTAHGPLHKRAGAIVELITSAGIHGLGEIAPLPEFAGSNLCEALSVLPALAASWPGLTLKQAAEEIRAGLESGWLPPAAACGLDTALLDAQGQLAQVNLTELMQREEQAETVQQRLDIPVNAVIGTTDIEATIVKARQAVAAGFRCLKLKVGCDTHLEIERIGALRAAIGPAIELRLDANEAWSFEQAVTILTACIQFAIQYVEQPLKATDLSGMRRLRQTVPIRIAADEALHDLASARNILAAEAADLLIVKPQLAGGLRMGRQIIREGAALGIDSIVTSTIEAGIGLAAALHLAAASPEITLACGLATLPLLRDDLLTGSLVLKDGMLSVPSGAGLGVQLDRSALARHASEALSLRG
ncbi:o-succinylbenzoate synthase [Ktedonosporobacter rubrisoli]|uniref:o-succinylbenzoate synthase n=1 Tax=Ktedonosporobacter rubrisoli TaxID=2509675 RepID=UPI0013EE4181|nr:o-succinylbenzoate synthase [Ktedonosporobacter rubrisoli]